MTREEAIEYLEKLYMMADITDEYGYMDDTEPYETAIDMAVKALSDVPDINVGKLISCNERLPDINEHHVSEPCIVYCENGAYGFAMLEENIFGHSGWSCERDDEYSEPLGNVIAWMPLPEPYREEQE